MMTGLSRGVVFRRRLLVLIPSCLFIGACAELFMIKTNFYAVATRKEAERKVERRLGEAAYWEDRRRRREVTNNQLESTQQPHTHQPISPQPQSS